MRRDADRRIKAARKPNKCEASTMLHKRDVAASREDLLRIVGDIDERKVLEILALRPTVAGIEEAAAWATGAGDVLGKSGHPLTGIPAQIFDILVADEDEPPIR
jgi:hypothetical protein